MATCEICGLEKEPYHTQKHHNPAKRPEVRKKIGKHHWTITKPDTKEKLAEIWKNKFINGYKGYVNSKKSSEVIQKHSQTKKRLFKEGTIKIWNKGLKGFGKFNKGRKHTEEAKKKMSEGRKGKISSFYGKKHSDKAREKMSIAHTGKIVSEETRIKQSKLRTGSKNPSWLGGKSFEPYGIEFNEKLREQIRKRDQYRCQQCFRHQDELYYENGKKYSLIVHHINYNKKNNNPENLISLCHSCHMQTNYEREDWTGYFNNKLECEK